jgi:hypothetical protein
VLVCQPLLDVIPLLLVSDGRPLLGALWGADGSELASPAAEPA